MKEKILQKLKLRYKSLGVSDKAFDGVAEYLSKTITEEDNIDAGVESVEPFLKAHQSEVDRERGLASEARKKLEELSKKSDPKPTKTEDNEGGGQSPVTDKILKLLEEQSKEIAQLRGERTQETKLQQINALLSEKKIPTSFSSVVLSGRTLNEDTNAEEMVASIETGYKAFLEEAANEQFKGGQAPERGDESNSTEMDAIIREVNDGTKKLLNEK